MVLSCCFKMFQYISCERVVPICLHVSIHGPVYVPLCAKSTLLLLLFLLGMYSVCENITGLVAVSPSSYTHLPVACDVVVRYAYDGAGG